MRANVTEGRASLGAEAAGPALGGVDERSELDPLAIDKLDKFARLAL
ncbi:hypothetical protein J8N05_46885 (plasmid) [Streptomyces sp. BH-SS-21]|uniref:Uncharacterized protein n=1 Tax=Streptomyces liliiviolaceus TaxID=2823109 RepID=A0A941BEW9_9ACTN|nr:hypothetical protein [Streptomyces liliiviolaceus]MBQ0855688.1 hypothetical protein [Streptomyces liliiviolaceus]